MMLTTIKNNLLDSIQTISDQRHQFVTHPDKTFTRNRALTFDTVLRTILSMGGQSLAKELLDTHLSVSNAAFVQRRYAINSRAFYELFRDFTAKIPQADTIPVLAVDGSDVCIPRNPNDGSTIIRTHKSGRSYNVIHLNALFDLHRGIYVDVCSQDKRQANEQAGLIHMMQASPFPDSPLDHGSRL